jgi:hypothetical protein
MTSKTTPETKTALLSLKAAFEAERDRRETERRSRDEAERKQQEQDLANAEELYGVLSADTDFLAAKGLTADRRRYTVSLDHADFRLAAYFEAGKANVTAADKRNAVAGSAAPRRQETVESAADALRVMAQFLADETR